SKLCGGDQLTDSAQGCGGNRIAVGGDELLDPKTESARIRAFFVAPNAARQGIGRAIYYRCVRGAKSAGFQSLELMATLPGVPFYEALGFKRIEEVIDTVPDGTAVRFIRMSARLADAPSPRT
ncbi:MAG: GNAT family N-acetyltransferase, partial [Rhodothermales bacterium]|nr:GNAT family N-acetyltransferase [Rhodothermales bacterium]